VVDAVGQQAEVEVEVLVGKAQKGVTKEPIDVFVVKPTAREGAPNVQDGAKEAHIQHLLDGAVAHRGRLSGVSAASGASVSEAIKVRRVAQQGVKAGQPSQTLIVVSADG